MRTRWKARWACGTDQSCRKQENHGVLHGSLLSNGPALLDKRAYSKVPNSQKRVHQLMLMVISEDLSPGISGCSRTLPILANRESRSGNRWEASRALRTREAVSSRWGITVAPALVSSRRINGLAARGSAVSRRIPQVAASDLSFRSI